MLKKFKKIIALSLSLLLMVSAAACNSNKGSESKGTTTEKQVEQTTESSETTNETTVDEDVALADTSTSFYVRGDKLISEADVKEDDIVIEILADASCNACVGFESNIKKFAYDKLNDKYNNLVWKYTYISFLDGNSSNIDHRSNIVPAVLMELNKSYPHLVKEFNDKIMNATIITKLYSDENLTVPAGESKDVFLTKKIFLEEVEGATEEIWNNVIKEAPKYILAIDRATEKAIADDGYYTKKLEEGQTLSAPAIIVGNHTTTINISEVSKKDGTMFDAISEKVEEEIAARANK